MHTAEYTLLLLYGNETFLPKFPSTIKHLQPPKETPGPSSFLRTIYTDGGPHIPGTLFERNSYKPGRSVISYTDIFIVRVFNTGGCVEFRYGGSAFRHDDDRTSHAQTPQHPFHTYYLSSPHQHPKHVPPTQR